ncbi:MAG: alpha/beta hydrolase [Shinella sp.]|uniref:alpha/beta hydrolase n=1 Tax=Shinella sp. TaxID=1870904 RepID=UPI003C7468BD
MKRVFIWGLGGLAALLALAVLAFIFTPWPSVALVQYVFSRGDQASSSALEKHVPANVVSRWDLTYGDGPDEHFDIHMPTDVTGPLPTIVWVHGGAWVAGSKGAVANYLMVLAGRGYTTVGIEYARGFGATYPGPVEQVNAALGYLVRNADALNIDRGAIILAGDSAGAQIAAQVALITTDATYARGMGILPALDPRQLRAVLLVSGAFDIAQVDLDGDLGWFVRSILWAYSGTKDFLGDERFGLASVAQHVTSTFPAAFISSGNGDPLAPQAEDLAQRLRVLGVDVDDLFFPADHSPPLPHEYQFNLDIPAGQEALERMTGFLRRILPRG